MRASRNIMAGCALAAGLLLSGCGPKEEALVAPAPPPTAAGVSMAAPADASAPPVTGDPATPASGGPPAAGQAAPVGPADEFAGMTPKQIEEFKKGATPETHDLYIGVVGEGAVAFFNEYGRAPQTVEQIAAAGFIRKGITAPKGKKYVIDPKTLNVTTVDQ